MSSIYQQFPKQVQDAMKAAMIRNALRRMIAAIYKK